jgi:hypothetical protein
MKRNRWMQRLSDLIVAGSDVLPVEAHVAEFDTAMARRILDKIDALTPPVQEALDEFNQQLAKINRPPITWFNYDMQKHKRAFSPQQIRREHDDGDQLKHRTLDQDLRLRRKGPVKED